MIIGSERSAGGITRVWKYTNQYSWVKSSIEWL